MLVGLIAACLAAPVAESYPLDGGKRTGIRRLYGYSKAQQREDSGSLMLPSGARLPTSSIELHLVGRGATWDLEQGSKSAELQAALQSIFRKREASYSVVVIDITEPTDIRWAGVREDISYYPGSIGKVLCMVALFDGLERAFPDPAIRERILRETTIEATDWVVSDSHKVPHFEESAGRLRFAVISPGDRFTLSEWVDHMISPSANAAGSTVWKEAILLRRFGASYPVSRETEETFFRETSKTELQRLSQLVIDEPLARADLDTERLQQGTMWTRGGKTHIPGLPSFGTARELARLLLRLEQGRLVDEWSSLEMKRYLYMTKKRYRYVYAPELAYAAVYFKSGSLYSCQPEEGFECGKYRGNVQNYMNSIAIVESPAEPGPEQRRYIVALMSNVLRRNSAWDHSRLGAAVDEIVRTSRPTVVREDGTAEDISNAGKAH